MSYHKATVKFSSNPTTSFSKKQTILYKWRALFHHWRARMLSNTTWNLRFCTTSVLLSTKYVNDTIQKALFMDPKNAQRAYRKKTGFFICNEPTSSMLYCAHFLHRCWRSLVSQSKFNTILCPFHPQVLEKSGFSVQVLPVLSFAFCRLDELYDALSSPGSYSSLVLTSPRVVQAIERALNIADNASGRCRHFFRCLL